MVNETSLDDVYRKFGEVSEMAQLLETELGNVLLLHKGAEAGLLDGSDPDAAEKILDQINRNTLGQLLWQLRGNYNGLDPLEDVISIAKAERNRLIHSFYRQHNFRRNSPEGCEHMLRDLESMHQKIIDAYKAVLTLSGIDLDTINLSASPTGHVPI